MSTVFQGIFAGGSATYLRSRMETDAKESASSKWLVGSLQVSHLLLLTAETLYAAQSPVGIFSTAVKASCALPIVALLSDYKNKEALPFTEKQVNQWNGVYTAGVVANAVATLALGNPAFAAASLSILAIDHFAQGQAWEKGFSAAKSLAGTAALIGYGAQMAAGGGVMAGVAIISAIVSGGKLFLDFARSFSKTPGSDVLSTYLDSSASTNNIHKHHYHDFRCSHIGYPTKKKNMDAIENQGGPILKTLGTWSRPSGVWI